MVSPNLFPKEIKLLRRLGEGGENLPTDSFQRDLEGKKGFSKKRLKGIKNIKAGSSV